MSSYSFPQLDVHQSRTHEPTEWEYALADAIESAFAKGHHTLPALIQALNGSRVRPSDGGTWTKANYQAVMKELGA